MRAVIEQIPEQAWQTLADYPPNCPRGWTIWTIWRDLDGSNTRITRLGRRVVRDNRVEVRVLFGRTSQKPRSPGGFRRFCPEVRRLIVRPKAITAYRSGGRRMRGTSAVELTVPP